MKNKIKEYAPYILTVLAIIGPWFFTRGYLFFTDFSWGPQMTLVWHDNWLLVNATVEFLSLILPIAFIEKLFIGVVFFTVLMGAKKVIHELLHIKNGEQKADPHPLLLYILSLFSVFNPFVYDRVMYGQFGTVLSFGFFLLSIGYLFAYLRTTQQKQILILGLFTGLMILFSPHFFFFMAAAGLAIVLSFKQARLVPWRIIGRGIFLCLVIILLINSNWLIGVLSKRSNLGSFVTSGISSKDALVFQTRGKTTGEVLGNVALMSGFWGKDQMRYMDLTQVKEVWGKSFLILLPILLLGVWVSFRNKRMRRFSIALIVLFIISMILAIGIRLPVARGITEFLYQYLPGYVGLREPQKWVSVIVFIYLTYLTVGVSYLFEKKFVIDSKYVVGIFICAVIVMQAPFLLFGFREQVRPIEYPLEWYVADQILSQDDGECDGTILFLPWHQYMSFNWTGVIISNPANKFFTCPVIQGTNMEARNIYDNSRSAEGEKVGYWLTQKGKSGLLSDPAMNIKYVLITKDVDWVNYGWVKNLKQLELMINMKTLELYRVYE